MPLTTETTEDCMGIVHIGTGTITGDEFVEASRAAVRLVQNTQNFHYEFVDLSEAARLEMMTEEHLEKIVSQDEFAATFRPDAVVVIVAPRDDFFEMARSWETKVRDLGWETHVDRDRTAALDWLRAHFPSPPREKLDADIAAATPAEQEQ